MADIESKFLFGGFAADLPIKEALVKPRNLKQCLEERFCNDDNLFCEFSSVQTKC